MSEIEKVQEQKPPEPQPEAQPSTNTLLQMLLIFFGTRRVQEIRNEEHKND
jgi:hypothetical protein